MDLTIPKDYDPRLSIRETEAAIRYIRETFQDEFGKELNLQRMSAPMFVEKSTGLNDNLNGVEQPVSFEMKDMPSELLKLSIPLLSGNVLLLNGTVLECMKAYTPT